MQIVMCLACSRGAVSFALSLNFPSSARNFLVPTTLAVVLVTTVCLGTGAESVLAWFYLPRGRCGGRRVEGK